MAKRNISISNLEGLKEIVSSEKWQKKLFGLLNQCLLWQDGEWKKGSVCRVEYVNC